MMDLLELALYITALYPILHVIAILLSFWGINLYIISSSRQCSKLRSHINANAYYSLYIDADLPGGLFVSTKYIGYIHDSEGNCIIYMVAIKAACAAILHEQFEATKGIKLLSREGGYEYFRYESRFIDFDMTPRDDQNKTIELIDSWYKVHKKCVVLIAGPTNTGKSMIGFLVAKKYNGTLCTSYNPSDPGDYFSVLYERASPTLECPLVVLINEVDGILCEITRNTVRRHRRVPTVIRDKQTWNNFFDMFKHIYPNTVIILTTNIEIAELNAIDDSYLRDERINIIIDTSKQ